MKKKFLKLYLQCTVNVATKADTLSTLLLARQLYSPLSILFTFVMDSCLLSSDKLILGLAVTFIVVPFMVHERLGSGTPLATHEKVTLDPHSSSDSFGVVVNSGATVISK